MCYDIHKNCINGGSMGISRTTILASDTLMERVSKHISRNGKNLTDFYNRAILNQLEKEGDFEIRDILEAELNGEDG